jgi:hypothetical protein
MNYNRAAGQELPGQVLAAARKGQERVAKSVRTATAAAQQIRPQLANLPRPTFSLSALPNPAQLREKAPEFVARFPARLPERIQTRLPSPEQLKTSAQELAVHARSVQRLVADQVRNVATPLAKQAAARLSQVGVPQAPAAPQPSAGTTTKVHQVTVTSADTAGAANTAGPANTGPAADRPASGTAPKARTAKADTAKADTAKADTSKPGTAKPNTSKPGTAKPKTGPADK